jgi:hypothetical protein
MGVLFWGKPKKKLSTEAWKNDAGFDGGPDGGYMPNMSPEDEKRWKAKLTGTKLGYPQVEIRKTAGSQMLVIVNLGKGYNYNHAKSENPEYVGKTPADFVGTWHSRFTQHDIDRRAYPTRGINVHLSMNGPAIMTFQDMADLNAAVLEAKAALEEYEATGKKPS